MSSNTTQRPLSWSKCNKLKKYHSSFLFKLSHLSSSKLNKIESRVFSNGGGDLEWEYKTREFQKRTHFLQLHEPLTGYTAHRINSIQLLISSLPCIFSWLKRKKKPKNTIYSFVIWLVITDLEIIHKPVSTYNTMFNLLHRNNSSKFQWRCPLGLQILL